MTDSSTFPTVLQRYAAASSPRKDANVALTAVSALPIAASREASTAPPFADVCYWTCERHTRRRKGPALEAEIEETYEKNSWFGLGKL